jgi:hypothetical protein
MTAMSMVNIPVILILKAVVAQCIHGTLEKRDTRRSPAGLVRV